MPFRLYNRFCIYCEAAVNSTSKELQIQSRFAAELQGSGTKCLRYRVPTVPSRDRGTSADRRKRLLEGKSNVDL